MVFLLLSFSYRIVYTVPANTVDSISALRLPDIFV